MKAKSIFQCAALLTGLLFLNVPLFAAVESDIVGYTTVTLEADAWYIIGNSFQDLNGVTEATLDNFFSASSFAAGDCAYIARGDGAYVSHYWNETEGKWSKNPRRYVAATETYPLNTGVYLHKVNAGTITIAGKVEEAAVIVFGSESGNTWEMTALPSPEGKLISDYTWTGCVAGDRAYVARGDGQYTSYYYFDDGTNKGWSQNPRRFIAPTVALEAGQAIYLNKVSAGTATIANP